MNRLKDKVVVVTGGVSGIGEAISKRFASEGAFVHIFDMNEEKAKLVCENIDISGGKVQFHKVNVSVFDEVNHAMKSIQSLHPLNILVNNAGIAHVGNLESTSEEDMDRLYAVNIKGVYHGMKAAVSLFKENGGGVFLNMASIASSVAVADRFAYSMTKGAVLTMTYSVAKDYIKYNIRCNCISPARIHTPFVDGFLAKNYPGKEKEVFQSLSKTQPIGRMGEPDEVANLALFLCSDEAAFITGTDYPVDGGYIKLNGA